MRLHTCRQTLAVVSRSSDTIFHALVVRVIGLLHAFVVIIFAFVFACTTSIGIWGSGTAIGEVAFVFAFVCNGISGFWRRIFGIATVGAQTFFAGILTVRAALGIDSTAVVFLGLTFGRRNQTWLLFDETGIPHLCTEWHNDSRRLFEQRVCLQRLCRAGLISDISTKIR